MTAAIVLLIITGLACAVACTLDDSDVDLFDRDNDE